jgi:hypothetical protein
MRGLCARVRLSPRSWVTVLALVGAFFCALQRGACLCPFLHSCVLVTALVCARPCARQCCTRARSFVRSLPPFLRSYAPHQLLRLLAPHLCTPMSALHLCELLPHPSVLVSAAPVCLSPCLHPCACGCSALVPRPRSLISAASVCCYPHPYAPVMRSSALHLCMRVPASAPMYAR